MISDGVEILPEIADKSLKNQVVNVFLAFSYPKISGFLPTSKDYVFGLP